MLNVLLTSLEEEAQGRSETAASKTASLSFYDDLIGDDDDDADVEDNDCDVEEEREGAELGRRHASPSPPPATSPGGRPKRKGTL